MKFARLRRTPCFGRTGGTNTLRQLVRKRRNASQGVEGILHVGGALADFEWGLEAI